MSNYLNALIVVFGPTPEVLRARREFKRNCPEAVMMSKGCCTSAGLSTFHIHRDPKWADHPDADKRVEENIPRVTRWLENRKPPLNLGFIVLKPGFYRTSCLVSQGPAGKFLERG